MLRDPAEQEISPLELIFDVVFVLAVAQLAHHLVRDPTWRGIAETATLYIAVFSVWLATSWAATLYAPDHPRTRRMMISIMVAGLFMNVAITRAYSDGAWLFVAAYLGIQVGRTAWMLTTGLDETNHSHYTRTLFWRFATAPVWIAGAVLGPDARLILWAAAALIDLLGTTLAHPTFRGRLESEHVPFAGEHLAERCRLFLLIALGETVLTPGSALVNAPLKAITLLGGTVAILSTLSLWWIYFRAEPIAFKHLAQTKDPMYGARMAANGIMASVAGLIILAAGNALVVSNPSATAATPIVLLLFGGPVVFLLAQVWYLREVFGVVASAQLITIAALAVGGALALLLPAVLASLAVLLILAGLAITDAYRGSIAHLGDA